jgi:DNA-binding MarR family transcriptional regulator
MKRNFEQDIAEVAAFRVALRRFLKETDEVCRANGLTPARYDLLVMVEAAGEGGATISALAQRLSLAANSVTELVDRAAQAGLVARSVDAADARATRVALTPEGAARIQTAVGALNPQRRRLLDLLADVNRRLYAR